MGNLQVLKPSRKRLRVGDVFCLQLPDNSYLFGRVILVDRPRESAPMPTANLIYVYGHRSEHKLPQPDELSPGDLLLPPLWINRLPWSRGYFETVAHWPLHEADLLAEHCFRSAAQEKYFDQYGNDLSGSVEPCGDWGLHSYRTIDDEISAALGIDLAPD
jgi:hypothetical protein